MSIQVLNTDSQLTGKTLVTIEADETISGTKVFSAGTTTFSGSIAVGNDVAITDDLTCDQITAQGSITERGLAAAMGVWTAYTPTWTNTVTQPVVGNGSIVGKYARVGKTIFFEILLTWGSTTTGGTGTLWIFGLPQTSLLSTRSPLGSVIAEDAGVADYILTPVRQGTTGFFCIGTAGAPMTQASPFTFGNTDFVGMRGSYEMA